MISLWTIAGACVGAAPGADTVELSLGESLATSLRWFMEDGQWWLVYGTAWLGGLLTSLTPCVYPLVPITVRFFGGMGPRGGGSRSRVLAMAVVYVSGMTLLYATLGTVFASFNLVFGSFLSSPWVVGALALFCAAMGASMLGAFTIQLPASLNTKLSMAGGNGFGGAFIMGLVSGLVAAPCTGPVLGVILAVIASTGELILGFSLMVAFGLGLGLPFLFLAIFSGALQRLPKGGVWMEVVKVVLSTAMFVVAIYFIRFAWHDLDGWLSALSGGALVVGLLFGMGVVALLAYLRIGETGLGKILKLGSVGALTVACIALFFGSGGLEAGQQASDGEGIVWLDSHDAGVARARAAQRPVMIDFTADWCQACKELDRLTYVDPTVQQEAKRFVNLKIDATEMTDEMTALFEQYSILGLPTVVFIDSAGTTLESPRVTGYVPPERFVALMTQVK